MSTTTNDSFARVEASVSYKTPIVMAAFALLVEFAFGVFGKSDVVAFQWSNPEDFIHIPDFVVGSNTVGIVLGIVLIAIAAASFLMARSARSTPRHRSPLVRASPG